MAGEPKIEGSGKFGKNVLVSCAVVVMQLAVASGVDVYKIQLLYHFQQDRGALAVTSTYPEDSLNTAIAEFLT